MLKHWTERQAAGDVPFWFKKEIVALVAATQKNNCTLEENDANSNVGLDEGAVGHLQSSDGSHALGNGESPGELGTNSPNEHTLLGQGLGNAAENLSNVGWSLKHNDSRC